jgi:CheY-like chemotaxis protein
MMQDDAILVVDDQTDFLDNVSLTLQAAGYNTITASDGVEALTALSDNQITLILSDIGMPNMGGYQFFQKTRQNPHWAKIPFLFLTGYEFLSENEVVYGKKLGINGYLTKPIRANELLLAVENIL